MKTFDERYEMLNSSQKKAVDTIEGPVMVIAGPGSGKTEILSLRVGNILRETDMAPSNILCMTFTDSAASNMRKRLAGLIGRDAYRVAIYTFHSFGTDVIDKNPEFFYGGASFVAADDLARYEILKGILENLPHDNPLRSMHPEQGFVYLKPTLTTMGQLKKAGLTPQEFEDILTHNEEELAFINPILGPVLEERVSIKNLKPFHTLIETFEQRKSKPFPVIHFSPLVISVALSLKRAVLEAEELGKSTPISQWKQKYTKKDDGGVRVYKDTLNMEKLHAVALVYKEYREEMHKQSFFDFDDMLLDTIQAIKNNDRLRYELQEQFQYILVDEFQDTNDAQIRLLRLLTDAEVHEGRPNIMVVGDDDQSVYKFQGAEVSNLLDFQRAYTNPSIITMTQNYRSTQNVLDIARHIILKGDDRLENKIPELEKELIASNPHIDEGDIVRKIFPTRAHEFDYLSKEIQRLIKEGKDPNDIAVISRNHKYLVEMSQYLNVYDVPVSYERKQNIFLQPHIKQIITMSRFISSLARKNTDEADEYLPEILSYPFWNLDRKIIWEIAVEAERGGKKRVPWLGIMRDHKDKKVSFIATFFDSLSGIAHTHTLEAVLDAIIGSHVQLVVDDERDDIDEAVESNVIVKSPFREYYFGADNFEANKTEYLTFLSGLRVFVSVLREYKSGKPLSISDLVDFVDLHEQNNIIVNDTSPFVNAKNAVQLLTAHKSKGLEFDTVFVISCQDEVWASKQKGGPITLPINLPITPAGDNFDDQLKLFFVAITRAKSNLYLTSYEMNELGKEVHSLNFLNPDEAGEKKKESVQNILNTEKVDEGDVTDIHEILVASWDSYHKPPIIKDEQALLMTLLDEYKMPVTHLNNFLNVSKGGPQTFLEQNLLKFPQAKTPSGAYGSAMHKAVELVYTALRKDGALPKLPQMLGWFNQELTMQRLSPLDMTLYGKRGEDALTVYYNERKSEFDPKHRIEVNFKDQGVIIGEAHIAGRIDKMVDMDNGLYTVVDFKTGHALRSWKGTTPYEKIKAHNYARQLVFYKLLVENSRDFMGKASVDIGSIEFLEPDHGKIIDLSLEIDSEMVERTKRLIEIVYDKITHLDFPDISSYSEDIKGIIAFEDDLLDL